MGSFRHAPRWLFRLLSNPAWFSALTSLGAMIIAVVAALYARRMWLIEQRRDEEMRKTQLRSQAAQVICVASRRFGREWHSDDPNENDFTEFNDPAVQIINRSDLPIFEISVTSPTMSPESRRSLEDNGSSPEDIESWYTTDRVPLEGEVFLEVRKEDVIVFLKEKNIPYDDSDLDFPDDLTYTCNLWEAHGRPAIEFTDARGTRWERDGAGLLHLLTPLS